MRVVLGSELFGQLGSMDVYSYIAVVMYLRDTRVNLANVCFSPT